MVATPPDVLTTPTKDSKTPTKRKTASDDSESESEETTPLKKTKKEESK